MHSDWIFQISAFQNFLVSSFITGELSLKLLELSKG